MIRAALMLVLATFPAPARGQSAGDSELARLRRDAWRSLENLERQELHASRAARRTIPDTADVEPRVRALLDSLVLGSARGDDEVRALRGAWPASPLLAEYDARSALQHGRFDVARLILDTLTRDRPAEVPLQRLRAEALARAGHATEAARAYALLLDLAPEDQAAWRALLELRAGTTGMEQLLAQVRRLRVRLPDSALLTEHEVELLERLGRLQEAADVARAGRGRAQ